MCWPRRSLLRPKMKRSALRASSEAISYICRTVIADVPGLEGSLAQPVRLVYEMRFAANFRGKESSPARNAALILRSFRYKSGSLN